MPIEGKALLNRGVQPGVYKVATISAVCFLASLLIAGIWLAYANYERNRPVPPSPATLMAVAQKMRILGGGPAGYSDRAALCRHITQNPDVAQAIDTQSVYGDISVSMNPGVSEDSMLSFANRLRDYMAANYTGDLMYEVSSIDLQSPDPKIGTVTVCTGIGAPDHSPNATWHVAAKGKMIE